MHREVVTMMNNVSQLDLVDRDFPLLIGEILKITDYFLKKLMKLVIA